MTWKKEAIFEFPIKRKKARNRKSQSRPIPSHSFFVIFCFYFWSFSSSEEAVPFINGPITYLCENHWLSHKITSYLHYLGRSCSTMLEHMPTEQNSWVHGFKSSVVLGFFLLSLSLRSVSLIRSLKEVQRYWISLTKNGCLAVLLEMKTSIICTDLALKNSKNRPEKAHIKKLNTTWSHVSRAAIDWDPLKDALPTELPRSCIW